MVEIDFFLNQMTNLLNTLGMGEREGNADERAYKKIPGES